MIVEQRRILGRTWIKLGGPLELVPVVDEPIGGVYGFTVRQGDMYYLGSCAIGGDIHEQWLLPTFAIYASPDARRMCPVELSEEGTLRFREVSA